MMLTSLHKAAVLGSPIAHSLSPALHRAAYRALGLDGWSYAAHEVGVHELPGLCSRLGPEWAGLSLTMPLKEVALSVAEEVSPLAREVGAVNTLVRRPGDGWAGHNTDVHGILEALGAAGVREARRVVLLGAGATARSAVAAARLLGAEEITFVVRDRARPETLLHVRQAGLVEAVCRPEHAGAVLAAADVVISTTPAGADLPVDLGGVGAGGLPVLLDVVYAGWPTPLAAAFADRGALVVPGFEMLLHQAAEQVRLMTGLDAPVQEMRAAGLDAMALR